MVKNYIPSEQEIWLCVSEIRLIFCQIVDRTMDKSSGWFIRDCFMADENINWIKVGRQIAKHHPDRAAELEQSYIKIGLSVYE